MTEQANVLGYEDLYRFLSLLSLGAACFIGFQLLIGTRSHRGAGST
jgi:hypothetical protein